MFELAVRLILSGGLVLLAGILGWENFSAVWITAACVCAYSLGGYWLEWKERKNPGVAGLMACLDAAAISALLATSGAIAHFGFLVLAPCAYAAAKYGSLPSAMAPVATFALLGADQWVNKGAPPTATVFGHAMSVLGIGLLLNHRRIIVSVAKPVLPQQIQPMQEQEPEAYMELRESFRKLKDMYHDLERKSRRDRFSADLRLALAPDGDRFHKRLAAQIKRISGADGISLYTLAEHAGGTVLRAVEGSISEPIRQSVLQVDPMEAIALVRDRSERALKSLLDPAEAPLLRNVVITHKGRVVGLVTVQGDTGQRVDEATDSLEEIAPVIGEILQEGADREILENRMRRAELMYELAGAEAGSTSRNGLAARVVRELASIVDLENVSVHWIDGEEMLPAATHGASVRPLEMMSFAHGPGLEGWRKIGAPEIVARDVTEDSRCRRPEMSKNRIQSLSIHPIGFGPQPLGVLSAVSPRAGAIDAQTADTLRLAAAELSQTLLRIDQDSNSPHGMASAGEIQRLIQVGGEGCIVYVDPVRKDELQSRFGRPAYEIAFKQLAHRIRTVLPKGAALYRRPEGDYLVYLPGFEENAARSWANEVAALSALVSIPVQEKGKRIPLAVRAKVAHYDPDRDQEPIAAMA